MILADTLAGVADEADAARGEIVQPAEIVEDFPRSGIGVKRVDGEVAPGCVLAPVAGEGHRGAAAVGADVMAQCRDLDRPLRQYRGDGAMLYPGRHAADRPGGQAFDHFRRQEGSGDVHVLDRHAQQRVAYRAAYVTGVARAQRGDQRGKVLAPCPVGGGQAVSHSTATGGRD
jgi:hypothetical protein